MATDDVFRVKCPRQGCEAQLKIRPSLPAGEYPCICRVCTVRVSWADYLEGGRKPYVSLVRQEANE